MLQLRGQSGGGRLISFLSILETLAESREAVPLSSPGYEPHFDPKATERVDRVYRFLLEHFRERIRLNDVARIVHLSPAAFCRHFRRATGKSLIRTVNDIRVGHACKLLLEDGSNASEACFASGFNNLAHYNRQFFRVTGLTPTEYKAKFSQAGR
jgi:AraC-like DNA-binding protein